MVALADLNRAMALASELESARRAIDMLASDGTLASVVVAPAPPAEGEMPSAMPTAVSDVPLSIGLRDALVDALRRREGDLNEALQRLGVT